MIIIIMFFEKESKSQNVGGTVQTEGTKILNFVPNMDLIS